MGDVRYNPSMENSVTVTINIEDPSQPEIEQLLSNGEAFAAALYPAESNILGMSTVHLNRSLQQLRREGLVIWSGTQVELPNPTALASLAQFSRGFQAMADEFSQRAAKINAQRLSADGRQADQVDGLRPNRDN